MESKTFLDQVRDVTRRNHYSIRTEEAWVNWIKRFIILPQQTASQGDGYRSGRGVSHPSGG